MTLIKDFHEPENEYMIVLEDSKGNKFETPGLAVANTVPLLSNDEVIIVCDAENTCKTGETFRSSLSYAEDRDTVLKDSNVKNMPSAQEFLRRMKKAMDYQKWRQEIKEKFQVEFDELASLITEIPQCNVYNFVRLLTEAENNNILFYNIPIRGKGSGDFSDIDSEDSELFSMFDKGYLFKLNRYYLGKYNDKERREENNDLLIPHEISQFTKYGANFLLDQVSYPGNRADLNREGSTPASSELTELGKKITNTGLKWFLEKNENLNNNDVYWMIQDVEKEAIEYINQFIKRVQVVFKNYFDNEIYLNQNKKKQGVSQGQIDTLRQTLLEQQPKDNKKIQKIQSQIDSLQRQDEIIELINNACDSMNEYGEDTENFKTLLKTAVKSIFLKKSENINLKSGQSVINSLKEKFDSGNLFDQDFQKSITSDLMSLFYTGKVNFLKIKTGGTIQNSKLKNSYKNLKFDFTATDELRTLCNKFDNLNIAFNDFRDNIAEVFRNGLPDDHKNFEDNFNKIDCDVFKTVSQNMNKDFLKKVLSDMLYSGDKPENLTYKRKTFLDNDLYNVMSFFEDIKSCILRADNEFDELKKPLPKAFYSYNKDDTAIRFTVINYVQAFFHAPLVVKRKKFFNMNWISHKRFNENVARIRRIMQTGTENERNQIFDRMRSIRNQNYQDDCWGLPLAFLDILLDGVSVDLSLAEKKQICELARNYVNRDLDNNTKEHTTKSNFMEINAKNNCYLKKNGTVVIPMVHLFKPGLIDKVEKTILSEDLTLHRSQERDRVRDSILRNSFFNKLLSFVSSIWHCYNKNENNLIDNVDEDDISAQDNGTNNGITRAFKKFLTKLLLVLLLTIFSPIFGIALLLFYISVKSELGEFNKISSCYHRVDFEDIQKEQNQIYEDSFFNKCLNFISSIWHYHNKNENNSASNTNRNDITTQHDGEKNFWEEEDKQEIENTDNAQSDNRINENDGISNALKRFSIRTLLVLLLTIFSPVFGIILLILYIAYCINRKNKLYKKFHDENGPDDKPNYSALKNQSIGESYRAEYNRLQNFRQNMQINEPPRILERDEQKINLNTVGFNQEFKIDLNQKTDSPNLIDENNIMEINTSSNRDNN